VSLDQLHGQTALDALDARHEARQASADDSDLSHRTLLDQLT
jgi:hypothetical protein